jgi:hypothetical protein
LDASEYLALIREVKFDENTRDNKAYIKNARQTADGNVGHADLDIRMDITYAESRLQRVWKVPECYTAWGSGPSPCSYMTPAPVYVRMGLARLHAYEREHCLE